MVVLRTLISLAATAMLIHLATAANYTIGSPNGGWDITTNLQYWSTSQSFLVGDNLIFQYIPNSHSVLEVSKADYDSCQSGNFIQSYNDGNTVITLSSTGKRYFICGINGHCSQGMKVEINTLAAASPPTSPSTPPEATPGTPAPQAAPPLTPERASPAPKISILSPAESPKSAPMKSPMPRSSSPEGSPPPSTDVPSAESPATSPPSTGLSPPSSPSSATNGVFKTTLTMGFSLGIMMLEAF